MKKLKKMSKFNSLYYTGLSIIVGFLFFVFILLSIISGAIIGHFSKDVQDDKPVKKIENLEIKKEKKIVYDTVRVEVYDNVKVIPKKIKPVVIENENKDSLN